MLHSDIDRRKRTSSQYHLTSGSLLCFSLSGCFNQPSFSPSYPLVCVILHESSPQVNFLFLYFLTAILLTALCSGLNLFILGGLAAPRFCNKLDSATQNAPKYRKIKGLLGGAEVCPPNSSVSAKGATFSEMPLTSGFLAHVPRCDRPCCPFPAGLGRCTMNRVYRLVGPM